MNRKHKKIIGMFVGALLMLCTISFPCFAEGTTTIHMSSANVSVGDTLSVTVTASESGKISLRYNDQVLKFSGSSASYTTGVYRFKPMQFWTDCFITDNYRK